MITKLELIEYLKHTPENTNYNILYSSLYNGSNKEAVDEFIEVLSRGNLSLAALQPYLAKLYEDDKTISPDPLPPFSSNSSVPKPLTYDYMPEGYPKKEQGETVIVENQTISGFQENTNLGVYIASNSVVQQAINNKYQENRPTIKILWDGTEYECQYIYAAPVNFAYGNTSLLGVGEDTGEPFLISMGEPLVISKTPGDSHEIKVSAVTEAITPMAEEFLPPINVPTKTSQLENNSGFVAASELAAGLADKQDKLIAGENITIAADGKTISATGGGTVPTNVSAFTNDSGYLTLDTLPKGVQPDWNQNDDTQPDYVKNRPFYTGNPVETVIIPTTTVAFSENSGLMAAAWPENFDLVGGQTYKVSWDGTDYVCTGILFNNRPVLGNLAFLGAGENTGEPFVFVNQGKWLVASTESATEHIIGIKVSDTPIVTLNENYLPKASADGYGVVKKSDIVYAYSFPANAPHDQMVDAINAFNTGNASIVWDTNKVINAYYNSSDDTISVSFAKEPLRRLTFSKTSDGFYNNNLGSSTYEELQGSQVRIVNDNDATAVLMLEGKEGSTTLSVAVQKFSVLGGEFSGRALILFSSTYGSDKKFKITVDDSGALSATEVTS